MQRGTWLVLQHNLVSYDEYNFLSHSLNNIACFYGCHIGIEMYIRYIIGVATATEYKPDRLVEENIYRLIVPDFRRYMSTPIVVRRVDYVDEPVGILELDVLSCVDWVVLVALSDSRVLFVLLPLLSAMAQNALKL